MAYQRINELLDMPGMPLTVEMMDTFFLYTGPAAGAAAFIPTPISKILGGYSVATGLWFIARDRGWW